MLMRAPERPPERPLMLRVRSLLRERSEHDGPAARGVATQPAGPQASPPERPFTISVGGPLDGIVTITAMGSPRVTVEATWGGDQQRQRISSTRLGERDALILADCWANQLIDGHEPTADVRCRPRWG